MLKSNLQLLTPTLFQPFQNRVGNSNYAPSPLSSRHGSQESLRHYSTMGSMSMLQTPTSSSRDAAAAAQKKKGIKSSLGRFFSKKEKVSLYKSVNLHAKLHISCLRSKVSKTQCQMAQLV